MGAIRRRAAAGWGGACPRRPAGHGSLGARLVGKFFGSVLATLVPVAIFYFVAIFYIVTQAPGLEVIPLAAAAFAAIITLAVVFVAGFSIAIPVVVKVPLYQFLFIGYWFAANLMSPRLGLPSLTFTWLNATGAWAQEGLFNFHWLLPFPHATAAGAYASITLLVGLGAAGVLLISYVYPLDANGKVIIQQAGDPNDPGPGVPQPEISVALSNLKTTLARCTA
jgi:hypothetical protein